MLGGRQERATADILESVACKQHRPGATLDMRFGMGDRIVDERLFARITQRRIELCGSVRVGEAVAQDVGIRALCRIVPNIVLERVVD